MLFYLTKAIIFKHLTITYILTIFFKWFFIKKLEFWTW